MEVLQIIPARGDYNSQVMLKAIFSFSFMTFISRITGFIRDILIARYFGASVHTDAFFVAFRIPNLFRRIFAEGAFNLSFIPILAEAKNNPKVDEKKFIAQSLGILTTVLMIFSLVGSILAPIFIILLAPGLENESKILAADLLTMMFPYIFLISLSSFFQSLLHSYHRFALGAITPIFLNISFVFFILVMPTYFNHPIYSLAIAVLVGGILQFIWPFYFAYRLKIVSRPRIKQSELTRKTMRNMLPIIFSSSASQINILVDTILASLLISGSISWLYFANRLVEMPVGIIGVALSTVGISFLSQLFQKKNFAGFSDVAKKNLTLALVFGIASFFGLFVLAEVIMVSLFQYGNFSENDAVMSAAAIKAYALGLPMILMTKVLSSILFAQENTKTPSKIAFIVVLVNIGFSLILMRYFAHVGLALASSIAAFSQALLLSLAVIKNKNFHIFGIDLLKKSFYAMLFSALLCLVMVFISQQMGFSLSAHRFSQFSLFERITLLGALIIAFSACYLTLVNFFIIPLKNHSNSRKTHS